MKGKTRTYALIALCAVCVLGVFVALGSFFVIRGTLRSLGMEERVQTVPSTQPSDINARQEQDTRTETPAGNVESGVSQEDKHPLLTEPQEKTLEKVGVDPSTLPKTITPELRNCVEEALGEARLQEILAGDAPGIADALRARGCL